MIRINLLPIREEKKKERKRLDISVSILMLILTFLISGYLYINIHWEVVRLRNQVRIKMEEDTRLAKKVGEIRLLKKERKVLNRKIKIIEKLSKNRLMAVRIMEALSLQVPDKMWFTMLQVKDKKVSIVGIAMDDQTLSVFISRLNRSKMFFNVWLQHSKEVVLNQIKLKEFSLNCSIMTE
jgi:type IV pilus assembly protein PilN